VKPSSAVLDASGGTAAIVTATGLLTDCESISVWAPPSSRIPTQLRHMSLIQTEVGCLATDIPRITVVECSSAAQFLEGNRPALAHARLLVVDGSDRSVTPYLSLLPEGAWVVSLGGRMEVPDVLGNPVGKIGSAGLLQRRCSSAKDEDECPTSASRDLSRSFASVAQESPQRPMLTMTESALDLLSGGGLLDSAGVTRRDDEDVNPYKAIHFPVSDDEVEEVPSVVRRPSLEMTESALDLLSGGGLLDSAGVTRRDDEDVNPYEAIQMTSTPTSTPLRVRSPPSRASESEGRSGSFFDEVSSPQGQSLLGAKFRRGRTDPHSATEDVDRPMTPPSAMQQPLNESPSRRRRNVASHAETTSASRSPLAPTLFSSEADLHSAQGPLPPTSLDLEAGATQEGFLVDEDGAEAFQGSSPDGSRWSHAVGEDRASLRQAAVASTSISSLFGQSQPAIALGDRVSPPVSSPEGRDERLASLRTIAKGGDARTGSPPRLKTVPNRVMEHSRVPSSSPQGDALMRRKRTRRARE
jgi:hypothetical protein